MYVTPSCHGNITSNYYQLTCKNNLEYWLKYLESRKIQCSSQELCLNGNELNV